MEINMDKNVKKMFLLTTIVLLLLGIGAVSAANDTSDNTQTTVSNDLTTIDSCSSQIATVASDNKVVNTAKNIKVKDKLEITFKDGIISSEVINIKEN